MKLSPPELQLYVQTHSQVHGTLVTLDLKPSAVARLASDHAMAAVESMQLKMLGNGNGRNGKNGKRTTRRGAK